MQIKDEIPIIEISLPFLGVLVLDYRNYFQTYIMTIEAWIKLNFRLFYEEMTL